MKAEFVQSLGDMLLRAAREELPKAGKGAELTLFIESGHLVRNRNVLFRRAMSWGAAFTLWLDDDHIFPDWALHRLLSLNLPVVALNQPKRGRPTSPTATIGDAEGNQVTVYTTKELAKAKKVEQVVSTGMAMCLVDMAVIAHLARQAAEEGRDNIMPLFVHTSSADPNQDNGEDVYFFRRLRDAGVPTWIDHWLSWETSHISQAALTMADTLEDRSP